ncbi:MAG: hypothetical protein J5594_05740 [Elusimicrobiaceae bacterium]|nr:hypothetical protein [Elusimicrobiaceae bacterium]MBR4151738.1 hypothetical protein [Selenomonadaceae bacterium]
MADMFNIENLEYGNFQVHKIVIYKATDEIKPKPDVPIIFWCGTDLYTGKYFCDHYYCGGNFYFPDAWAYQPINPF